MNERIAVRIGKNIRKRRLEKGLSQSLLGDLAHIPVSYIRDTENGSLSVTLVRAHKIAGALGCDVSELFMGVET